MFSSDNENNRTNNLTLKSHKNKGSTFYFLLVDYFQKQFRLKRMDYAILVEYKWVLDANC